MLFEKIRRTQKPVFIFLALIFGIGFVFLGVGSGAGGLNPLDFLNSSSSSSSINDLNDKVRSNPQNAAAWLALAQAYQADGQTEPALGAYQQYLQLKPNAQDALLSAAALYEQSAQDTAQKGSVYQQQLQDLQGTTTAGGINTLKFSSSLPSPIITNLTTPLQQQVQGYQTQVATALSQAIAMWKRVLKLDPTNSTYWRAMAQDALNAQDYPTAVAAVKKILKLEPDAPDKAQLQKLVKQLEPLAKASQSGTTTPAP
ncbi:MAG: tetratricopeptide repeat protein [Gaiellales bacterium]